MINFFKRKTKYISENIDSSMNLKNKTFILKRDYLNPFVTYYVTVLDVKDDWVQYNYVLKATGPSSLSPDSKPIKEFLSIYAEIRTPFDYKQTCEWKREK